MGKERILEISYEQALEKKVTVPKNKNVKLAVADGALKDPSQPSTLGRTIAEDLLDVDGKLQCNSCNDVHTSGVGRALRGYNYGYETIQNDDGSTSQTHHGPELCRMCHLK